MAAILNNLEVKKKMLKISCLAASGFVISSFSIDETIKYAIY